MEKEKYLTELGKALAERGLSQEELSDRLAEVGEYLDTNGLSDPGVSPEELADSLIAQTAGEREAGENVVVLASGTVLPDDEYTSEDPDGEAARAAEAAENAADPLDEYSPAKKKKNVFKNMKEKLVTLKNKLFIRKKKEEQEPAEPAGPAEPAEPAQAPEEPEAAPSAPAAAPAAQASEDAPAETYDFDGSESTNGIGGKIFFWATLIVALPFILLLALLALVIYVAIWVVLAVMMIACITLLIVFVGGGVAISFIGIVYGALQIIKGSVPVGLFEIGLGIIVGAVVMLVSILIYNFAVRLIPYVMKQLTKLLSAAYRGGRVAVEAVKGACERA